MKISEANRRSAKLIETKFTGGKISEANKDLYNLGEMKFSEANRRSTKCNGVSSMRGGIDVRRNGFRSNR